MDKPAWEGGVYFPPPQQRSQQIYQQGYPQTQQPLPASQSQKAVQEVKFYKSGFFGFRSAAGKLQRDCNRMISQGWQLQHTSFLGLDFWLRRIIIAVYEK